MCSMHLNRTVNLLSLGLLCYVCVFNNCRTSLSEPCVAEQDLLRAVERLAVKTGGGRTVRFTLGDILVDLPTFEARV